MDSAPVRAGGSDSPECVRDAGALADAVRALAVTAARPGVLRDTGDVSAVLRLVNDAATGLPDILDRLWRHLDEWRAAGLLTAGGKFDGDLRTAMEAARGHMILAQAAVYPLHGGLVDMAEAVDTLTQRGVTESS